MDILAVCLTAFLASLLTLFSGFGLGTLLMPVVALFFPLEVAIATTAIVHLSNNLMKLVLLGKHAVMKHIVKFGVPATLFAFIGAYLLIALGEFNNAISYQLAGYQGMTSYINIVIGGVILFFVALEISPKFSNLRFAERWLPYGGALSGFFGGLSGHQGAFRSMFLVKSNLDKKQFIGTGVVIAVLVDVARLFVYGVSFSSHSTKVDWMLVTLASLCAFIGVYLGSKFIEKITINIIKTLISLLLVLISFLILMGII